MGTQDTGPKGRRQRTSESSRSSRRQGASVPALYQQEQGGTMSPLSRIIPMATLALVAGCARSSTDLGDIPDDQDFLFEVEYVNYAWGFVWRGFHVDRNGDVRSYTLESSWPHVGANTFSKAELLEKYDVGPARIGTIDLDKLRRMVATIPAAAAGALGDPVQRCADAGTVSFVAWTFDAGTARYSPTVLRMEGDIARENRATEAYELYAWLQTLAPGFGIAGCEP
jgi:hypothetical protein